MGSVGEMGNSLGGDGRRGRGGRLGKDRERETATGGGEVLSLSVEH